MPDMHEAASPLLHLSCYPVAVRSLLGWGGAMVALIVMSDGCRDWDRYDPRLAPAATSTSTAAGGVGGTGGTAGGGHGGGGAGASGGGGAAGGAPTECGGLDGLSDDFEGDALAHAWTSGCAAQGVSHQVVGGVWRVQLDGSGYHYCDLYSRHAYDLSGDGIVLELAKFPANGSTRRVSVFVGPNRDGDPGTDDHWVAWQLEDTQLQMARDDQGAVQTIEILTFDPVAHRWWQLRDNAGTFEWRTSPDGNNWTAQPKTLTAAEVTLGEPVVVEVHVSADPGGTVVFELGGINPSTSELWCAAATAVDDFDDQKRGPLWSPTNNGELECTMSEDAQGHLRVDYQAGDTGICRYLSGPAFDLTASTVTVQLVDPPNEADNDMAVFALERDYDNLVEMRLTGGTITLSKRAKGIDSKILEVPFDAMAHGWWRISQQGSSLHFQVASDGKDFKTLHSLPTPFAVDAVEIQLGGGRSTTGLQAGQVAFDNLGLASQ